MFLFTLHRIIVGLTVGALISGTNGYVVRNLSAFRSRDSQNDRANAWDATPPKHREPDKEILEHERKRKVEVKCLELQLELEDKGQAFYGCRHSIVFSHHVQLRRG